MNFRREQLLKIIIETYIATALPVGSAALVARSKLNLSSATIRKEMSFLENEGLIEQPHTSAGRIPTEKAYRLYADTALTQSETRLPKITELLERLRSSNLSKDQLPKQLAKLVAEITGETVILGFGRHDVYHTGIAHLFSKPEFSERARVTTLSLVVDRFEEIVERLYENVPDFTIAIGSQCPFGSDCAAIFTSAVMKKSSLLLILLGPLRMNYRYNINVIKQTQAFLKEI